MKNLRISIVPRHAKNLYVAEFKWARFSWIAGKVAAARPLQFLRILEYDFERKNFCRLRRLREIRSAQKDLREAGMIFAN